MKKQGFTTQCIHAGGGPDPITGACAAPLYMTNAYAFENTEHARSLFALEQDGYIYTRLGNPTNDRLEQKLAALEGGTGALLAASGHAALTMAIFGLAGQGDEIVSARSIYGGVVNLLGRTLSQLGIKTHFVDANDPEAFARATNEHTRAYFVETIGNPLADVPDLEAIARVAHANGLPLIADNTIATPYLLRPIDFGADIVLHSTTKFMGGNGTAMGGAIIDSGNFVWKGNLRFPALNTPDESYHGIVYADLSNCFIAKLRAHILRDTGGCQSPFNAWLTMLGLETLALRMERHCQNALAVAKFLQGHALVESVGYPLLDGSPYRAAAEKYLPRGAGSVFSFTLKGGRKEAAAFCDSLKLISIVSNLGDCRTIVSNPATTTHSQLSDQQLAQAGISPGLVRISVGLEDAEDILEDLAQALQQA